jgi:hypothetical protein
MRALRYPSAVIAAFAMLALPLAARAGVGAAMPAARTVAFNAGSGGPGDGCTQQYVQPNGWTLVCSNSGGGPGSGGGGGGNQHYRCTLQKLDANQVRFLGLPPPPKGQKWAAITCPGPNPFGGVTLVGGNGTPAVTPQDLLQIAEGELRVPWLVPGTAPPMHHKGLVGLPEWFWIRPSLWRPVSVTVSAGPVWATVTASPVRLTFDPGSGQAGTSCPGPGTPYSAAAARHANPCTYTYTQSSARQPGGAYQAALSVIWQVSWTGSGGVGGMLNAGLPMPYPFPLRIAEGQALVNGQ